MSTVGQIERKTQDRVVKLFQAQLGYAYLGDWSDRENINVEWADHLLPWLIRRDHSEALITRVQDQIDKARALGPGRSSVRRES